MVVTIEEVPKFDILDETNNNGSIRLSSPIYHSWLRHDRLGIIGIKFSPWMVNRSALSKSEQELLRKWGRSEEDFEVFFGGGSEYNRTRSSDDAVLYTSIVVLGKMRHGLSFPLFGETVEKQEVLSLETNLARWSPDVRLRKSAASESDEKTEEKEGSA